MGINSQPGGNNLEKEDIDKLVSKFGSLSGDMRASFEDFFSKVGALDYDQYFSYAYLKEIGFERRKKLSDLYDDLKKEKSPIDAAEKELRVDWSGEKYAGWIEKKSTTKAVKIMKAIRELLNEFD